MPNIINVGIDIDGVLGDLSTAMIPLIQRDFGVHVAKEDATEWNFYTKIVGDVKTMLAIMDEAWLSGTVPLEEGGLIGSLSRLHHNRFHKHIISARTMPSHPIIAPWLHSHKIPYDTLTLLAGGTMSKFDFPIDVLIDDRPSMVEEVKKYPLKYLYLRDQPWNRSEEYLPGNAMRVSSVAEAVQHILENFMADPHD